MKRATVKRMAAVGLVLAMLAGCGGGEEASQAPVELTGRETLFDAIRSQEIARVEAALQYDRSRGSKPRSSTIATSSC
ncbi:MAG: hypothetical protein JRG96_18520 [Deltaproteobacteria bacterium]|nr:hypothetical protein [Deltaproteobacteria bacterium]